MENYAAPMIEESCNAKDSPRKMYERVCAYCGQQYRANGAKSRYCTRRCFLKAFRAAHRSTKMAINCSFCGRSFLPRCITQRFCSVHCRKSACYAVRRKPKIEQACEYCGKPVLVWHSQQRYCSVQCRTNAHRRRTGKVKYPHRGRPRSHTT